MSKKELLKEFRQWIHDCYAPDISDLVGRLDKLEKILTGYEKAILVDEQYFKELIAYRDARLDELEKFAKIWVDYLSREDKSFKGTAKQLRELMKEGGG